MRNDCGVYEGAEVPIYYDPMIAKLITWGENRVEAILRMRRALREYQVRGIKTNISFHQWILRHPRFMSGDFNTGFIDEEYRDIEQAKRSAAQRNRARFGGDRGACTASRNRLWDCWPKAPREPSKWREQGKRNSLRSPRSACTGRGWRRS